MNKLQPFGLEDFFDQYEHDMSERINLASSDAAPWTRQELGERAAVLDTSVAPADFAYPDFKALRLALAVGLGLCDDKIILPTNGAAEAIALVMHELSSREHSGRRVALPAPSYGAFEGLARLLGMTVTRYDYARSREWGADPSEIVRLGSECDALVILNPHNPTGHEIEASVLHEAAMALEKRGGTLVIDEVFRDPDRSVVGGPLALGPHVVVIGSLSKMYGLPGLRLGWVMADAGRLSAMRTVQQYLSLSAPSATMVLAKPILADLASFSRGTLVRANRATLMEWAAAQFEHLSISNPAGGTTVVLEVKADQDEDALFQRFLGQDVLLVPGRRFDSGGDTAWFRLGYGTAPDRLKNGLARIDAALRG